MGIMFHYYNILLLSLCLTYSISNDYQKSYSNRTIVSSRSVYDLVQLRRAAARLAKLHRNNHTTPFNNKFLNKNTPVSKAKISDTKLDPNRVFIEHLKILVTTSSIAVGFMAILVVICVAARYYQDKHPIPMERVEARKGSDSSKPKISTTRYIRVNQDIRNFSRKPRTLPMAV